jgi:hypothetical protein
MRIPALASLTLSGLMVIVLSACGSSGSHFSTSGLIAPDTQCMIDPHSIGDAEKIDDIDEGNGCQVSNAWRLRSAAGVSFSRPATVNCGVVGPLDDWIAHTVQPAAQQSFGESVVGVDIAASYACRARNNEYGAKMSEHGFGNAIDISGFTLESGRKITVREGWRGESSEREFLSEVRRDACGEFRTVLGPGTPHHRDHFHLDLANRRSGKAYCT